MYRFDSSGVVLNVLIFCNEESVSSFLLPVFNTDAEAKSARLLQLVTLSLDSFIAAFRSTTVDGECHFSPCEGEHEKEMGRFQSLVMLKVRTALHPGSRDEAPKEGPTSHATSKRHQLYCSRAWPVLLTTLQISTLQLLHLCILLQLLLLAPLKMQRVKKIDYSEDDFYSEDEEEAYPEAEQESYTDDDRHNFATLTPVVRAELDEAGLQASDIEIEEALWHYYWDVGKSAAYLKNSRTPRAQEKKEKVKAKSKFELAAERSRVVAGECVVRSSVLFEGGDLGSMRSCMDRRGGLFCLCCIRMVLTVD